MSRHSAHCKNSKKAALGLALCTLVLIVFVSGAPASEKDKKPAAGRPPSVVVVSPVGSAVMSPEAEFVGTVYYKDISEVASEVSGQMRA